MRKSYGPIGAKRVVSFAVSLALMANCGAPLVAYASDGDTSGEILVNEYEEGEQDLTVQDGVLLGAEQGEQDLTVQDGLTQDLVEGEQNSPTLDGVTQDLDESDLEEDEALPGEELGEGVAQETVDEGAPIETDETVVQEESAEEEASLVVSDTVSEDAVQEVQGEDTQEEAISVQDSIVAAPVESTDTEGKAVEDGKSKADKVALKAQAVSSGPNLTAALKAFGVASANVLEATTSTGIVDQLAAAKKLAANGTPYIVHVPNGSYTMYRVTVPKNVILVAEADALFTYSKEGDNTNAMVSLNGSLYGGSYNGKYIAANVIYFGETTFSGVNGVLQKATITNAQKNGVCVRGDDCKGAQIKSCTIKNNALNGISVENGATCALISNCVSSNNGYKSTEEIGSGINITHADVTTISGCTLATNKDKGISTNSDVPKGKSFSKKGCKIGTITGCTIKGNKQNGVYLKPFCYVSHFTKNKLVKNKDGLVVNGKTAAGLKGTSWAKDVKGNTFDSNVNSNVAAQHSGATLYLGGSNKLKGSKKNSVIAYEGGEIEISGTGTTITGAKLAGISCSGKGSSVIIKATGLVIQKNTKQGIYCSKGKVSIKGSETVISNNKDCGIMVADKGKVAISGESTAITSNKPSGIYVTGASVLSISGKATTIKGSPKMGLHIKASSTVTITGAGTKILSNKESGIGVYDKSVLTMTGKKGQVSNNGIFGVYAKNKAKATFKKTTFKGNKKGAKYAAGGAKISGAKTSK